MSKPPAVTPLELLDANSDAWLFAPLHDITPYENALLGVLFVKLTLARGSEIPDWRAYLKEHKLERHFKAGWNQGDYYATA